ncbi:hypothetical protein ACIBCA_16240 [Kitasatospora sp. NPDC051170]|uniref:hypothetical protein n=1 Tax=Kitasatospora sp. NPDC051170 TaxID=3364056 RepID=UPI0037A23B74
MTTADRTPHPWSLNGAATLVDLDPSAPRRSASSTKESIAATNNRMLLDEHRSEYGLCVRCESPWPCHVTRSVRNGGTA